MIPFPSGRYTTIVADPPWAYTDAVHGGRVKAAQAGLTVKGRRGAAGHYPTLTTDEIRVMPVMNLATADAHLYLWCTNAFVEEAHIVARAWGFRPNTLLTWVKPGMGMGFHWRNNTEHVLFAVRGQLRTLRRDQRTAFEAPRGRHSEKPEAFMALVEQMSPGPYLELFARTTRPGWTAWGRDVAA